eukprot:7808803-Lingulodinium_polyedra.AAC.1
MRTSPWHGLSRLQWQRSVEPHSAGSLACRRGSSWRWPRKLATAAATSPAATRCGFPQPSGAKFALPRPM